MSDDVLTATCIEHLSDGERRDAHTPIHPICYVVHTFRWSRRARPYWHTPLCHIHIGRALTTTAVVRVELGTQLPELECVTLLQARFSNATCVSTWRWSSTDLAVAVDGAKLLSPDSPQGQG